METITKRVYIIFSVLFISTLPFRPIPLLWVIKAVPALAIALLLIKQRSNDKAFLLMGVGFIASAAGDVFLDLDRSGYFVQGLGSFLVAHILYTLALLRFRGPLAGRKIYLSLVILLASSMLALVFPKLGKLAVPVTAYILVIATMTSVACLHKSKNFMVTYGAIIFMCSDSLIAIDKFLVPLSWSHLAIMITYFTGNYMIGMGFYRARMN